MALETGQRRAALAIGDLPLRKSFRHGDTESGYPRKRCDVACRRAAEGQNNSRRYEYRCEKEEDERLSPLQEDANEEEEDPLGTLAFLFAEALAVGACTNDHVMEVRRGGCGGCRGW